MVKHLLISYANLISCLKFDSRKDFVAIVEVFIISYNSRVNYFNFSYPKLEVSN
jgi:hypothetical protein